MQTERIFINQDDLELIDDGTVEPSIIDCSTFVRDQMNENISHIHHALFKDKRYPSRVKICCYHCTYEFKTVPVPICRRYDEVRRLYHVYGVFCSLNCAKAYMLEHNVTSSNDFLYFTKMCHDVFHVYDPINPAPPKVRLEKFGGDLSIEVFRQHSSSITSIEECPPFVHIGISIQQRKMVRDICKEGLHVFDTSDDKSQVDECLYTSFIKSHGTSAPETAKKKQTATNVYNNKLDKFITFG